MPFTSMTDTMLAHPCIYSFFQSKAFSHAAAAFSTVTSSHLRPTNMMPVGSFNSALSEAGTKPHGSDKDG